MSTLILQLSDLHLWAEPEGEVRGLNTRDSLRTVLDAVRAGGGDYDRVVVTGDFTHDERRETYQVARAMLADWLDRCDVLPGNHDERVLMREVFEEQAGGSDQGICFSRAAGGWRLIGVDTHVPGKVPGRVEPAMLDWLQGELQQHATEPTIIFQHHPPTQVDSPWLDGIGLQEPEPYRELIRSSPQVRVVSCGHVHQESASSLGSSVVLTVPSTSVQFVPMNATAEADTASPGYRVFALDDPGDSDATAVGWSTRVIRVPRTHVAGE